MKTKLEPNFTRRTTIALAFFGALGALSSLGGCREALLRDDEARSQYDRYDALRDQRPPARVEDAFGTPRPNLRGRLLNKQ